MSKHKKPANPGSGHSGKTNRGGKARTSHQTTAEQLRESVESARARESEASIRDRMVDIGRGNKQAGRQKP